MNASHTTKKKFKKPKQQTLSTSNPEASSSRHTGDSTFIDAVESVVPLLAKDSEWVDIMQTSTKPALSIADEEEVLQLVDCEDGPDTKPLAIMFPGLLEKDPQTLQGMLTKAMSTTEVTKHLVDLGQKANFTFMKKANRLIPPDKLSTLQAVNWEKNPVVSSVDKRQLGIAGGGWEVCLKTVFQIHQDVIRSEVHQTMKMIKALPQQKKKNQRKVKP